MNVLRNDKNLGKWFRDVRDVIEDAHIEKIIGQLVALLAITVATMGAGVAVGGFVGAGGLGWSAGATTAAVVTAEAFTFTVLNTIILEEDATLKGATKEFAYNLLLFGTLRKFTSLFRATGFGGAIEKGGKYARVATGVEMAGQAIIIGAAEYARAAIKKYEEKGETLSKEEIKHIALNSIVMFVAISILGRVSRPILAKLEGKGRVLGQKIRLANEQRKAG